jgi:hypothetical protein
MYQRHLAGQASIALTTYHCVGCAVGAIVLPRGQGRNRLADVLSLYRVRKHSAANFVEPNSVGFLLTSAGVFSLLTRHLPNF